jgi:Asp-tRNA(Asn)/Glu-tRNA(Gln) amidotransferase A subunit family amidase
MAKTREELLLYYRQYNATERPQSSEYQRAYYADNKERISERRKAYRAANKERIAVAKRADYEANKAARLAQKKEYRQRASANIAYLNAARKKVVRQRTPKWLTDFDKLKIRCIYSIAAMLKRHNQEPWHVDHVIPLQGTLVSGLHVPNNLQVMRGKDNISKKNKFEVVNV